MKKLIWSLFFLLPGSAAWALGEPVQDSASLLGCWKRVIYTPYVMRQMNRMDFYDPQRQKYQWFCFFENQVFRAVTASKDGNYSTAQIRQMFDSRAPTMTWSWVREGIVRVDHKDDPAMNAHWQLSRMNEEMHAYGPNTIPKGALIMAIPTADQRDFLIVRVLQKVPEN